jgi:hypothetical protein
MKKRFIVLIDFSDYSEWLLSLTYNWTLQVSAELILVHHIVHAIPGLGDAEVVSEMKRNVEEQNLLKLRAFTESVIGYNTSAKYYIDLYGVSSAVTKLQEQGTIDYLFVGMNDKTALENIIVTSTALQLRDQLNNIIIALPTAARDLHFESLHVGINQAYPLNDLRFQELLYIMRGVTKHINFFSVLKNGASHREVTTYMKALCDKYQREFPTSYNISEANNAASAIKGYMKDNQGVLVVQKGPRNIMDIFRRFFTTEIILHAQVPVIILP